jgi:hypothetical protein
VITVPFVIHRTFIWCIEAAANTQQNEASNHPHRNGTEEVPYREHLRRSHFRRSVRKRTRLDLAGTEMNGGNSREKSARRFKSQKRERSARAAAGDHALVQDGDPAGSGAFAKTWDHGMEKAGEAGQEKRPSEGNGLALMLEIGLPDGLGMDEKKPRKHGQDPDERRR